MNFKFDPPGKLTTGLTIGGIALIFILSIVGLALTVLLKLQPQTALLIGLTVVLGISLLSLIIVLVLRGIGFSASNIPLQAGSTNRSVLGPVVGGFLIVALLVLVLIISFITSQYQLIYVTILVILGTSLLVLLLFIMAAGFSALGLSDPKQAVGLPKGTIRALIALLLIIVWVIVSIFLSGYLPYLPTPNANNADGIKLTLQLSQQLYTTMATLVVAIVGFYFGTRSTALAGEITGASSTTVVLDIAPDSVYQNKGDLDLTIIGKNFRKTPDTVQLTLNGTTVITATNPQLISTEKITCHITFPADQKTGQYDVVVIDADGQYPKPKAFAIKAP